MDSLKDTLSSFTGTSDKKSENNTVTGQAGDQNNTSFGGLGERLNQFAGGGRESEKNEDYLDKGVDLVQEKLLGQGPQDNENALEQAKDEQISDYVRGRYKAASGSDLPFADK